MPMTDEELQGLVAAFTQSAASLSEVLAARGAGGVTASASAPPGARTPAPRAARMAARNGRAQPSPEVQHQSAHGVTITAAASCPGVSPGQVLTDRSELAELTSEVLEQIRWDPENYGRKHVVARARWDYPEERRLSSRNDAFTNSSLIEAVCAPEAVLASGGVCLPVNVDYSVPTWSTAQRPFRDGLPGYEADRGGIRFVSPPDIGVPDLQGSASGAGTATRVWTEATDAAPAGQTKPVWTVACGSEQLVYVNAIPTRIQFGNMFGRFAPEQVAANTEQAIAVAAREAELELLTLAYNSSKQVKPVQYLGATRDLLASVDLLIAQYRYSHRIPRTARFTCVFPDWAKDLIRSDMARELAHDTDGGDRLAVSDAQIEIWFSVRGINVIWTLDGLKTGTYGTGGSALANQFGLLGSSAPEPQWPNQASDASLVVGWLLYVEGTYQFLDGGRLDLGVVRDSTLDATNDYETFVETFEGLAFRGLEAYQVQSTVLPSGGSAGTVAQTGYHE
jgi:hypothetical protein